MIRGAKIYLRPLEREEIPRLAELENDIAHKGEYWPLDLMTRQELYRRFDENAMWDKNRGMLLICAADDHRIVGHVNFFTTAPYADHFEIGGSIFRREDRGRGFMTEALRLFCAYLFAVKTVGRLQAGIIAGNTPSRRMAEKCGFRHEGVMRRVVVHNGKRKDMDLLSLLREECPPLQQVIADIRKETATP